jgi:hypothetical protein
MKIQKITSQHRHDFSAEMVCEHCASVEKLTTGYDDANYHNNVIPAFHCGICGKNRAGALQEITIDPVTLVATMGSQQLDLPLTELRVMSLFLHNEGKVLGRKEILAAMQSAKDGQFSNLVDVYVNYLRQKIGKYRIVTVRGEGYCYGEVAA